MDGRPDELHERAAGEDRKPRNDAAQRRLERFTDRALIALCAVWGFAEATLFFIVPDVAISAATLRGRRLGLWCAVLAVVTALAGGLLMREWARDDPQAAVKALARIPTVSPAAIDSVDQSLKQRGPADLFVGSVTGKPYKIYAVQAGRAGMPLGTFILFSIAARAARFVVVVFLVDAINRGLRRRRWTPLARGGMLAGVWAVIYAVFIATHGW